VEVRQYLPDVPKYLVSTYLDIRAPNDYVPSLVSKYKVGR